MKKSAGWFFRTFFGMMVGGTVFAGIIGAFVYWHFSKDLPKIVTVADYRPPAVTRILGSGGKEEALIGEFYGKERRYLIPYEKIPEIVVRAFISAEDDQFFEHPGINIVSILRASIANFRAGHVVQGGSTITQQVAKSLVLTSERSFERKVKEIIVASRIERNLTKQQILYLYLNQIYLGHGAYGVQSASKTYFRKDVSNLTIAEAALLAGLPQAPGKYSPLLNPKKAKERQLYVLRRLFENKYISQSQMADAAVEPVKLFHDEDLNKKHAAYLVEHIRRYLLEKYGDKATYEGGLTVIVPTTPELSASAVKSLRAGLEAVDKRMGYRGPIQKLKRNEEIEKFQSDTRLKLIERKIGHSLLMPDGRMDAFAAMESAGLKTDADLLDVGERYHALVTAVNDKKKAATVTIGSAAAQLPLEHMRWARPVRDEQNPTAYRPEPAFPSKVLSKGDVIRVKVIKNGEEGVVVGLDQDPVVQGALFSLEVQTGNVLAMEGGYDFETSEFNRAVQAQRQAGSSFKPIIYSAALEKGYTPTSVIVDSPIIYEDADTGKWKPNNFEEKFYGDTTFRQALIKSRNVPTIKLVQAIQVSKMIEYARRLGMSGQFPPDLSISLGSAAISLMELTRTYALFPRLGQMVTPIFITKVIDRDGNVLEEQQPQTLKTEVKALPKASPLPAASGVPAGFAGLDAYPTSDDPTQVMDPRIAYVMTNLMKEVVAYGTGHEAKNLGRVAAGKTGTTNEYIDAWFMGFTPHVVTGVWVGFDNQRTIGQSETGAKASLPIWLNFMKDAVKGYPDVDFTVPPGVIFASIDGATGKVVPANASNAIKEAFVEGTEPNQTAASSDASQDTSEDFFKEDVE